MGGGSGQRPTCRALQALLLLAAAMAAPAAAAPVTSPGDPTTSANTGASALATEHQLLDSLPQQERVVVMAFQLAAALQRLAEQAATAGDVTEEATARIVTRQEDASDYSESESESDGDGDSESGSRSQEAPPATTPLHRALALQPYGASVAKSISLTEKFQSTLNRWVQATSNVTSHKVMKVRAKITVCFPRNICFEVQDPWGLCCPF